MITITDASESQESHEEESGVPSLYIIIGFLVVFAICAYIITTNLDYLRNLGARLATVIRVP